MIPAPPYSQTEAEAEEIKEAVSQGKLLSYVPTEGWAYRSKDEINAAPGFSDVLSTENIHWPVFKGQSSTTHETV